MFHDPFHMAHSPRSGRRVFLANDPRFLITAFALILMSVFVFAHTNGLLCVLVYVLVLHRLAGLSVKTLTSGAKNMAFFVLFIIAINSVLNSGEPLIGAVPFISREGLAMGVHQSVRVLVLYFTTVVFLGVASPEDIARGLSAFLKPFSPNGARRVALYGFLSIGFLPVFADEVQRIRIAQGFRGGGMEGSLMRRLAGVRLLLVPVFLSAVQRSGHLAVAVELRDIKTTIGGILVLETPSQKDYVFVVVTAVILVAAWLIT